MKFILKATFITFLLLFVFTYEVFKVWQLALVFSLFMSVGTGLLSIIEVKLHILERLGL